MRINMAVWIPILGILVSMMGDDNSYIWLFEDWVGYQKTCSIILSLIFLLKIFA